MKGGYKSNTVRTSILVCESGPESLFDPLMHRMHDLNGDNLLDGLELFSLLMHSIPEVVPSDASPRARAVAEDLHLSQLIDEVLATDDLNHDGYLSFAEFRRGQLRTSGGHEH